VLDVSKNNICGNTNTAAAELFHFAKGKLGQYDHSLQFLNGDEICKQLMGDVITAEAAADSIASILCHNEKLEQVNLGCNYLKSICTIRY